MHAVKLPARIACLNSHSRGTPKHAVDGFEVHRNQGDVRGYGFERDSLDRSQRIQPEPDDPLGCGVNPGNALRLCGLAECHHRGPRILSIGMRPANVAEARLPLILRKKVIQQSKKTPDTKEV